VALETVLVGWDGASFSLLDPLVKRGLMPHLKAALSEGTRADLLSIVPALTPPAWTSLATGRSPGYHGVFDFFQKESPGSIHLRLTQSWNVRAKTIWEMANSRSKRATLLNFPVTFPPPPVDGYVMSGGWLTPRQLKSACHPSGLYEEVKTIAGVDPRALIIDLSEEEKALEGCPAHEMVEFVEKHIQRERLWSAIVSFLLDRDPTELLVVVFDGTDKIQHLCWPLLVSWARGAATGCGSNRLLEVCLEYYRELDAILGRLIDRLGTNAHFLLVSDHGFGESHDLFFVNEWLCRSGFLAWKDRAAGPKALPGQSLGMSRLARHVFEMDWEKTVAFAATPSSNGIHLFGGECAGGGSPPGQGEASIRDFLIEGLLGLKSPTTGKRLIAQVWKREEVFKGPYGALGPDLTLGLWDGGLVSILGSEEIVRTRSHPVGAHRPEGIFLGMGPAFEGGRKLERLSLLDVAPMVLHLLGLPLPEALEGTFISPAFSKGFLKRNPVSRIRDTEPEPERLGGQPAAPVVTEEDEEIIAERLRRLGYLE